MKKVNSHFLPSVMMAILMDVYLRPKKLFTSRSRYLWKLYDEGLVTSKDGLTAVITPRGKNYLAKNIELLTPEDELFDLERQRDIQQECI